MMKSLSVIGTAAMFLVGGGILTHGVPVVHHWIESVTASAGGAGFIVPTLLNAVAGIVAGAVVLVGGGGCAGGGQDLESAERLRLTTHNPCGSELARDEGLTSNINVA